MQKTAYEMRISDWSSDVCSSDLQELAMARLTIRLPDELYDRLAADADAAGVPTAAFVRDALEQLNGADPFGFHARFDELHSTVIQVLAILARSEEHTSELQSLMRISYAVFCLKQKNSKQNTN